MDKLSMSEYIKQQIESGQLDPPQDPSERKQYNYDGEDERDVSYIAESCPFIAHCREDAQALSYGEWFAMISILAHGTNGEAVTHEYSEPYAYNGNRYSRRETQANYVSAVKADMPQTCNTIKEYGYCPKGGCKIGCEPVTSPIQFAREIVDFDDYYGEAEEEASEKQQSEEQSQTKTQTKTKQDLNKGPKTAIIIQQHSLTDLGNARRYIDAAAGQALWCNETQQWHAYDGKRWINTDGGEQIAKIKHKVLAMLKHQFKNSKDVDVQECYAKHISASQNIGKYEAMEKIARREPGMGCKLEDFDQDDYLFDVENGVIDLRSGELRPHDPTHMISKISPVIYDKNAKAPVFNRFLTDVFDSDTEIIDFMRRWLGMQLTGDTSARKFAILWGTGSNGKSTLCNSISHILGDYSITANYENLMTSGAGTGGEANPAICAMQGKRFLITSEGKLKQEINSSLIKQFTGSDTISTRQLYGKQFTFLPKCKINMLTNFKPDINGIDGAVWDRLILIPFEQSFPTDSPKRDTKMQDKLIAETAGIFNWLLAGCIEWQQQGLRVPQKLLMAAQGYRDENDYVGSWLQERCSLVNNVPVQQSRAWEDYCDWARGDHEAIQITKKSFTATLKLRGYGSNKTGSNNVKLFNGFMVNKKNDAFEYN